MRSVPRLLVVVLAALLVASGTALASPPEQAGPPQGVPANPPPFSGEDGDGTADGPVTAGPPTDYAAVSGLSEPEYDTIHETHMVEMRDGIEVYIEVTRPDADGEFPVIFEASPYHGTLSDRDGIRIFPDPVDENGNNIGMTGYFAPRGYAVAMMSLRGSGRSQGCLDHMGPKDRADMADTIEWLVEQEWSAGKVGMTGHSYVGSTPKFAAAEAPEGLTTIVPSAGIARAYDHQFQHGVAYSGQWLGLPAIYNLLAMDRHHPISAFAGGQGDNFGNDMEYYGCSWTTSAFQDGHRQVTGEYSAFHAERDHAADATAWDGPVFMVQGLYDNAVRPNGMDWFVARDNPEDKLWYGQFDHGSGGGGFPGHPNRRFEQWQFALHAWFDAHLQGRDVDTGPPVELFMNGEPSRSAAIPEHDEVVTADAFPIAAADTLTLFPDADGTLDGERATSTDSVTFTSVQGQRETANFITEPAAADTVLAGTPELDLVASLTQQNLDLIVTLNDVDPEAGTRRQISQFAMNPHLREGIATPAPVVPGQRYRLQPPGWHLAHVLEEGHQLEMEVTTVDADKQGLHENDAQIEVVTGRHGTELRLPVVDAVRHADVLRGVDLPGK